MNEIVRSYVERCRQYLNNAFKSIKDKKPEKASEHLWGAMAQAIKALAASRNRPLYSHNQIKQFAKALAREMKDDRIWADFLSAQALHTNFYEGSFTLEETAATAEIVERRVKMILQLIPGAD